MENVTYYFASNKNELALNKIVSDPLFKKIVNYLSEHNEQEVILRQIKADISTEDNIELYLDKLIKFNLVERKSRRYYLTFPIYNIEKIPTLSDTIIESLQDIIQETNNYFVFGEWLWSLFFEEEQGNYFFGVKESLTNPTIFRKVVVGNDTMGFVSVFPNDQIPLDLANYFNLLSRSQELPEHFKPLQQIIGDVDINYFIPQIKKVMRSIKRNKSKENKKNIFQEALLATKDLIRNDEDQLVCAVTILEHQEPSAKNQVSFEQLKMQLSPLWETIEDENQRMFFKQQLYSTLYKHFLPHQPFISYYTM